MKSTESCRYYINKEGSLVLLKLVNHRGVNTYRIIDVKKDIVINNPSIDMLLGTRWVFINYCRL